MPLRESIGQLSATLVSMVRTRLELFSLEAAGQKSQWLLWLVLAISATGLAVLALLVFTIGVALYFWPTDHRYTAIFVLALLYALGAVITALVLRRKILSAPAPFSATLEELQRDKRLIERLASSGQAAEKSSPAQDDS